MHVTKIPNMLRTAFNIISARNNLARKLIFAKCAISSQPSLMRSEIAKLFAVKFVPQKRTRQNASSEDAEALPRILDIALILMQSERFNLHLIVAAHLFLSLKIRNSASACWTLHCLHGNACHGRQVMRFLSN